jgi:predicted metal-dependent enzyme (double-stranded beta helix superfamily)
MFDIDEFVAACSRAVSEDQPHLAVREVLERALRRPGDVAAALPATTARLVPLHASHSFTVVNVVWAPRMHVRAHNHLMWTAIGVYGGQEDNTFYRRTRRGIAESGGRTLRTGEVALLGEDTIHAVTNPLRTHAGAIHVYGGDITTTFGRSEWDEATGIEVAYDPDRTRHYFETFDHAVEPERRARRAG